MPIVNSRGKKVDVPDLPFANGPKTVATVARPVPMFVNVEKGRKYAWCSCGMSAKQPFCDGAHKGTNFKPVIWEAPETKKRMLFCLCKTTKTAPFCDMSHLAVLKRMYGRKVAALGAGGALGGVLFMKYFMSTS